MAGADRAEWFRLEGSAAHMSTPDISIVMGVYNNADTLPVVLDSILSQKGITLEFIAIDDGSIDGSGRILDKVAQNDSRLKVLHQQNTGLTRALITGCKKATAPWIARQDADDISLPGRLAALWALTQKNPDAVLLASSAWFMGPRGERLYRSVCTPDPVLARRQVKDLGVGPPAHGATMFSRAAYEAVGGYRPCFYYGQDADLWMRLAEYGGVVYADEVFYECRLRPGAISGSNRKQQKAFGKLGQQCRAARRSGRNESPFLAKAQALANRIRLVPTAPRPRNQALSHYHIGSLLEKSDPTTAAVYFKQAIAFNPWAIRPRLKLWRIQNGSFS